MTTASRVRLGIIGVIVLVILLVVANSFTVVQAGTRGVVKTFGEVTTVFGEGLHFRTPFITEVEVIDVRTQRFTADSSAASKDLQIVTTQVVLNYSIEPSRVGDVVKTIGSDYDSKIIDPAIQESVKAATAQFTAEQLITQRPLVSQTIKDVLVGRLAPRNIRVEDLSITDFKFSEEFARAIESKQVAEQDTLRAERELERVQIESQQQVAQAEAEATARISIAEAEAEALRLQREVISPELLQLRFIEKWNGTLPTVMSEDSQLSFLLNLAAEAELEGTAAGPSQ